MAGPSVLQSGAAGIRPCFPSRSSVMAGAAGALLLDGFLPITPSAAVFAMSGATAVSVKKRLVRREVGCKRELVASGEEKWIEQRR